MEEKSGTLHTDEAKKVFADAIATANKFRAGLEQLSADFQAGKEDEARQLIAQLRDWFPEMQQYNNILGTWGELDQVKTLQAARGKDNADLNARCDRVIGLLNKRLDLVNQISALNRELMTEREGLQPLVQNAPGNAPAAAPPKSDPKPAAKPNEPS
jgi:acyl-CoA reductase-like NAD-dependent aldehyde dehydrogenase